jgi:hypothetical protein
VPRTPIIEREPEPALSEEQISHWQFKIRAAWQKTISSIIEVAVLLKMIHREVPRGQWGRIFEGPHAPFTSRMALMLIDIAEHSVLANPKYTSDLPCCWYSLLLLSSLSAERLEWLIMDKTVNPALTQKEVKEILNREKSRERRASTVLPHSDHLPYPPEINADDRSYTLPGLKNYTPPIRDTFLNMQRLLVDMRDTQDEIRRDSYYRKQFRKLADCILGIVEGDPVVDHQVLLLAPPPKQVEETDA